MLYCKNCGGTLYEEEVFYDEEDEKFMQVGCLMCSNKLYIPYKKWINFIKSLNASAKRIKDEKSKTGNQ